VGEVGRFEAVGFFLVEGSRRLSAGIIVDFEAISVGWSRLRCSTVWCFDRVVVIDPPSVLSVCLAVYVVEGSIAILCE